MTPSPAKTPHQDKLSQPLDVPGLGQITAPNGVESKGAYHHVRFVTNFDLSARHQQALRHIVGPKSDVSKTQPPSITSRGFTVHLNWDIAITKGDGAAEHCALTALVIRRDLAAFLKSCAKRTTSPVSTTAGVSVS